MPDDPNKKQNEGQRSTGDVVRESQKRPPQGGDDTRKDRDEEAQGQKRVS